LHFYRIDANWFVGEKETFIHRLLRCPDRSFFLFGPGGTGKSTWLGQVLPEAVRFDLLDTSLYLELSRDPHRVEAMMHAFTQKSLTIEL
jgi:hypothetical protein